MDDIDNEMYDIVLDVVESYVDSLSAVVIASCVTPVIIAPVAIVFICYLLTMVRIVLLFHSITI